MTTDLFEIAQAMRVAGLGDRFAARALHVAQEYRGVAELMQLWVESEDDPAERDETVADLQELLDDIGNPVVRQKERWVRFDDLDRVAADIMAFKDALRIEVEKRSSLTELAEKTGMPLPSLSRFFSQPSMPRRATLLKIADALELTAVTVESEWAH